MDTWGENLFQFSAWEDAKRIFSKRKLAILWKSKFFAAPLQNRVITLPVSTIGLFLQAQLLTFKKIIFLRLQNCSKLLNFSLFASLWFYRAQRLQFQVSPEVLTQGRNNRPNPSHAEFGFLQFQQNWGCGCSHKKSHKAFHDGNCAPWDSWDPIVKLSKGTEEFINRLKVSFISENVATCMGDTFPWENHQEFRRASRKGWVVLSCLCHPISNGLEKQIFTF